DVRDARVRLAGDERDPPDGAWLAAQHRRRWFRGPADREGRASEREEERGEGDEERGRRPRAAKSFHVASCDECRRRCTPGASVANGAHRRPAAALPWPDAAVDPAAG